MKTKVHTAVRVSDLKRSVEFYAKLFEINLRVRTDHWAELEAGGARLLLLKSEEPQKQAAPGIPIFPSACYLGVETDDLDGFHSKILSLGARCVQPPLKKEDGDRIAIYTDPDGLALQITELEKFGI